MEVGGTYLQAWLSRPWHGQDPGWARLPDPFWLLAAGQADGGGLKDNAEHGCQVRYLVAAVCLRTCTCQVLSLQCGDLYRLMCTGKVAQQCSGELGGSVDTQA